MKIGQNTPTILEGLGKLGNVGLAVGGQRFESVETSYDPDTQVEQTMPLIQGYASADSENPMVGNLAGSYIQRMPGASPAQIAWQAAKDHLVFQDDQVTADRYVPGDQGFVVEVLRRPVDVIMFNRLEGRKCEGDCDDFSMFAAAMGAALGADVQFVTVAANPDEPGVLSHIYTMIDGTPVDASHGEFAGWEVPPAHVSRREFYSLRPSAPFFFLALAFAAYVFGPYVKRKLGL